MTDWDRFIGLIESSSRIGVLTGAGISTLSGIPDFRSAGGIYSKKYGDLRVEDLLDIDFFMKHPEEFYSWARNGWYSNAEYRPNIVHESLRLMEEKGILTDGIWTQNIDSLDVHCGSKRVYELHGTLRTSTCTVCGRSYTFKETRDRLKGQPYPKCDYCSGLLRPDIVFYGENLDSELLMRAYDTFSSVDLTIVLGSSLVVNPVASLPSVALQNGRKVVIVNRDKTYLDNRMSVIFRSLEEWGEKMYNFLQKC